MDVRFAVGEGFKESAGGRIVHMSDPFFISCVILSNYPEKDLMTESGVIETANYEITSRDSEMSTTWAGVKNEKNGHLHYHLID